MNDTSDRFATIERRLARIERALGIDDAPAAAPLRAADAPDSGSDGDRGRADTPLRREPDRPPTAPRATATSGPSLASAMALLAGIALVLAAVYFIRLVYVAGWLTPGIQVGLALLTGVALIVGGERLGRYDRHYAAFMPAAGIVVLFLALFAAHLYYGLIPQWLAIAGVAAVSLTGLWLSRRFDNSIYAIFAAVGVYLTPLFIRALRAELLDLVIYFTAWSLLFSFAALSERRRSVYLVAMFLALIGFDLAWRIAGSGQWLLAALYQSAQFLIFAFTAGAFSIMHGQRMTGSEAVVHGVGLFYFYVLEYVLLKQHAPTAAPWIALASVVVVLALYALARVRLRDAAAPQASAALVSTYAAVVTAHVVLFDLTPSRYLSLGALLMPVAALLLRRTMPANPYFSTPPLIVGGAVFALGLFRALVAEDYATAGSQGVILLLYAAVLYGSFAFARRDRAMYALSPLLLVAAHIATLIATSALFDSGIVLSLIWAVFAVALLLYAVRRADTLIGRSSLLIFAASAIKVLIYDLTGSAPAVRIVVLVVLAVSLYLGGWLYQRMSREQERYHPDAAVNAQLNLIAGLVGQGLDDDAIVARLDADAVPCLAPGGRWSPELVAGMRRDYGFKRSEARAPA